MEFLFSQFAYNYKKKICNSLWNMLFWIWSPKIKKKDLQIMIDDKIDILYKKYMI